jgi:hypothetical protein
LFIVEISIDEVNKLWYIESWKNTLLNFALTFNSFFLWTLSDLSNARFRMMAVQMVAAAVMAVRAAANMAIGVNIRCLPGKSPEPAAIANSPVLWKTKPRNNFMALARITYESLVPEITNVRYGPMVNDCKDGTVYGTILFDYKGISYCIAEPPDSILVGYCGASAWIAVNYGFRLSNLSGKEEMNIDQISDWHCLLTGV